MDACWLVWTFLIVVLVGCRLCHVECIVVDRFCACGSSLCFLTRFEGPKSNPAKLPVGSQQSVYELFAQIFCTAIDTAADKEPVRYLSP